MDADPRICLAFLYKNDPFYSLCLSDLLTAPQQVKNKFLKEQKDLTMTIKKLEQQKLSRLRQLDEEKKQFTLLMRKKLSPGVIIRTGSSMTMERGSQRTFSSVQFSSLASSKSSWKKHGGKPHPRSGPGFFSAIGR
ncbi:Hypothetical predicted protein [Podarcis lilfordi]|uniref:Uncharacterized protein n=1 Tax=Podarcis lilfordi TaxID=74358 RepID=A0AA35LIV9_9SAUR|nr:Hypothetical predicted protein [Podarcis lilfordi]